MNVTNPAESHLLFISDGKLRHIARHGTVAYREGPKAICTLGLVDPLDLRLNSIGQRAGDTVFVDLRTDPEDLLRCTLGYDQALVPVRNDNGNSFPEKIKGDLVDFTEPVDIEVAEFEDRIVKGTF